MFEVNFRCYELWWCFNYEMFISRGTCQFQVSMMMDHAIFVRSGHVEIGVHSSARREKHVSTWSTQRVQETGGKRVLAGRQVGGHRGQLAF